MKTDYRIIGKPYRTARRTMVMESGFATRDEAEAFMAKAIKEGACDPYSWTASRKVSDSYEPVHAIQEKLDELLALTEEQRQAIGN